MDSLFTVQRIERTITFDDPPSEDYTDEYDEGSVEPATLREALDALKSDCWDSVDERGDGTIICYPADSHQNYQVAAWQFQQTQIIIKAKRPEWTDRLMRCYYNTKD